MFYWISYVEIILLSNKVRISFLPRFPNFALNLPWTLPLQFFCKISVTNQAKPVLQIKTCHICENCWKLKFIFIFYVVILFTQYTNTQYTNFWHWLWNFSQVLTGKKNSDIFYLQGGRGPSIGPQPPFSPKSVNLGKSM